MQSNQGSESLNSRLLTSSRLENYAVANCSACYSASFTSVDPVCTLDRDSCKLAVFGIVPLLCLWILCVLFDRHSSRLADVNILLDYTSC
jgi:hypothetical protein